MPTAHYCPAKGLKLLLRFQVGLFRNQVASTTSYQRHSFSALPPWHARIKQANTTEMETGKQTVQPCSLQIASCFPAEVRGVGVERKLSELSRASREEQRRSLLSVGKANMKGPTKQKTIDLRRPLQVRDAKLETCFTLCAMDAFCF